MNNAKQIIDNHNKQSHTRKSTTPPQLTLIPFKIRRHATADKRTHAHSKETAYNHQSSTKLQSHATTTTQQKHTSDSQKTTSKQDTETIPYHSATLNTETRLN